MYRSFCTFVVVLLLGICFAPSPLHAQYQDTDQIGDLRGALKAATEGYADNYVQPITDAFGTNINSGLFRSADVGNSLIPGFPLNVYLGVSLSGALTASMNKRFVPEDQPIEASPPTGVPDNADAFIEFTPGNDDDVPTAFGETETPNARFDLVFRDQNGNELRRQRVATPPPGLLNVPIAPFLVPQLQVGSVAGTDVQLRWVPTTSLSGYGEVSLFGLGLRHDLDQWIPGPTPFNIAVQGAWNQFSLAARDATAGGDSEFQEVLSGSGFAVNLQASKGVPVIPLIFYGGLQYETFGAEYSYRFDVNNPNIEPIDVSLDQSAGNSIRGVVGFSLTLAVIRLNVDYAVSTHNTITAGLGVRL